MPVSRVSIPKTNGGKTMLTLTPAMRRQMPVVLGFFLLLAIAGAMIWIVGTARSYNLTVAHTLRVRSSAYLLLTLVQDAETGQRGYLLTKDKTYLAPYDNGLEGAPAALDELDRLTLGSPAEHAAIATLRTLVTKKFTELKRTVALTDGNDDKAALALVKSNGGNDLMEQIRLRIGDIQDEETRMIGSENNKSSFYGVLLGVFTLVGVGAVIGLGAYTIILTNRNTRELQAAQGELKVNNENLEGIVESRVADLRAANEEIQRFAYIVSHDLRAPLVNVMGFTSELEAVRDDIVAFLDDVEKHAPALATPARRTAVEVDLPEALGFIRTSTAKMDRLINAILKLSREGRRVLTPQPIGLRDLVLAQRESLSHQLAESGSAISVQDGLPDLVNDRLAIEQIFGNLLENATKYLAPGRPGEIAVTGKTIGAFVRYEIKDNGRGIDKKDFERIFELFRRSGEQDKPGEGIGLAHVRNLVRRLGGDISVASELGKGSTFTITLPAILSNLDR